MSRLNETRRATMAEELIAKAIRSEQRNKRDDFSRGKLAGLRSAFILLTGGTPEDVPELTSNGAKPSAKVINMPQESEIWDAPVSKPKWDFPVRDKRK